MQNITPFLWFDKHTEEAVNFYVSTFTTVFGSSAKGKKSEILLTTRYGDAGPGIKGEVMIINYKLLGENFTALNGGPVKDFTFNHSMSFFVHCKSEAEVDKLFQILSAGGEVRMPVDKYPFSEKFTWFDDRYGVSWQVNLSKQEYKISPFLWFKDNAEEAMNYYTSIFNSIGDKKSEIKRLNRFGINEHGPMGKVQFAEFTLNGQEFIAMDSNKNGFTPAISLFVNCDTQNEVDTLWDKLTSGGKEIQCGWLTDKFGVTWQIVPTILGKLMSDPDYNKSQRVTRAMMKMIKIESEELIKAYEHE